MQGRAPTHACAWGERMKTSMPVDTPSNGGAGALQRLVNVCCAVEPGTVKLTAEGERELEDALSESPPPASAASALYCEHGVPVRMLCASALCLPP